MENEKIMAVVLSVLSVLNLGCVIYHSIYTGNIPIIALNAFAAIFSGVMAVVNWRS